MHNKPLQVQIRNNLIYPICKDAKTFAKLLKTKTFDRHQIKMITHLGYVFELAATHQKGN
jgi:hypothetical protein